MGDLIYIQTKKLWDEGNKHHSEILLEMSRVQLRMITNLVAGHNTLGSHMVRLGIANNDICRWCREAVEDSCHFLCECPALSNRRFNILGLTLEAQTPGYFWSSSSRRNG